MPDCKSQTSLCLLTQNKQFRRHCWWILVSCVVFGRQYNYLHQQTTPERTKNVVRTLQKRDAHGPPVIGNKFLSFWSLRIQGCPSYSITKLYSINASLELVKQLTSNSRKPSKLTQNSSYCAPPPWLVKAALVSEI